MRFKWYNLMDVYAGVRGQHQAFMHLRTEDSFKCIFGGTIFIVSEQGIIQPDGSKNILLPMAMIHTYLTTMSGSYNYISRMKQQRVFMLKERILHIN